MMTNTVNPGGRPSLYTPEIVEEICDRLSQGEPLEQICRDDHMPASRTVWAWQYGTGATKIKAIPEEESAAITRAREIGFDQIAYNVMNTARGKGDSSGDVQRDKLIVETDLKLLAKWLPKKYGDSTILRGDKENPLDIGLAALLEAAAGKRQVMQAEQILPALEGESQREDQSVAEATLLEKRIALRKAEDFI